ncbi:MAG: TIGR01777 family protein [Sulfurospirillum sp.]|nr:TIGR01777 family protein [Sulfurospirillum sp.]
MKIAINGASGFVGTKLREIFPDHVIIHRDDSVTLIQDKLNGVDLFINLAGAPIIKRWSKSYKKVLFESRIQSTQKAVLALKGSSVKHFISTSAIGIYPDDKTCDETCKDFDDSFLANLAVQWEEEAKMATIPTTILRFGIVLGRDGGALAQMLTPFRFGVGGIIGDGKMMMSWIDIDDLLGIIKFVAENKLVGTFNACAPQPVSNYVFTKTLGKVLEKPTIFPLPEFVLQLIFGEAASVLTGSKEIYPKALQDAGFTFAYQTIEQSLKHLLQS